MARRVVAKRPTRSATAGGNSTSSGGRKKQLNEPSTQESSSAQNQRSFLLEAPEEVRNEIYKHVVDLTIIPDGTFHFWALDDHVSQLLSMIPFDIWPGTSKASYMLDGEQTGFSKSVITQRHQQRTRSATYKPANPCDPPKIVMCHNESQFFRFESYGRWHPNVAILLVCRQIYNEVVSLVYSRTTFAFGCPQYMLKKLLSGINPDLSDIHLDPASLPLQTVPFQIINLPLITSLCLDCQPTWTRSNPSRVENRTSFYHYWTVACVKIVKYLPSLKQLRLHIDVPDGVIPRLSLTQQWVEPFLQFRRCEKLVDVAVCLNGNYDFVPYPVFEVFAQVLRRVILGWDLASAVEAITYAIGEDFPALGEVSLSPYLEVLQRNNRVSQDHGQEDHGS